jgi:hypothetical protein
LTWSRRPEKASQKNQEFTRQTMRARDEGRRVDGRESFQIKEIEKLEVEGT